MTDRTIGQNIRRLRLAKNWSQQRLANEIRFTKLAVHNWEIGRNEPRAGTIKILCHILDAEYEEILGKYTMFDCGSKS